MWQTSPSRHHFTWRCPDRPVPEERAQPVTVAEGKLLIRAICKLVALRAADSTCISFISRSYKKPGVSELVALCRVLHLVYGKSSQFHFAFRSFSWQELFLGPPPGQHSANLWRQLNSLADTKANYLANRAFSNSKPFVTILMSQWTGLIGRCPVK